MSKHNDIPEYLSDLDECCQNSKFVMMAHVEVIAMAMIGQFRW